MASISTDKRGVRRILFTSGNGSRRKVHLGKVPMRIAEQIKTKIEAILAAATSLSAPDPEISRWIADIPEKLAGRLAAAGLIQKRKGQGDASGTLGPFLDSYIKQRVDVKGSTATVYGHTRRNLIEFFGEQFLKQNAEKRARLSQLLGSSAKNSKRRKTMIKFWGKRQPLATITEGDADAFRLYLLGTRLNNGKTMAKNTVNKRCQIAKLFFKAAKRQRLIGANPFGDMKGATVRANRDRDYFLERHDAQAIDLACPDAQWRLIVALSRFGGLRCPSEHLAMRWTDVNWERSRIVVHSPKTEHRPGQESRVIPIFPELVKPLRDVFEAAPEGTEFVITRYRDGRQNLRTQFLKIIRRAGLTAWPRLFHNLRASRQTELMQTFPIHVVCEWLGNSRLIAQEHYLRVTEADFRAASEKVAQIVARQPSENDGNVPQRIESKRKKTPENAVSSAKSEVRPVVATGLEPVTSTMSTWRSNQLS